MPPKPNELLITRFRSCQGANTAVSNDVVGRDSVRKWTTPVQIYNTHPLSSFKQARVRAAEPGVGGLGVRVSGFRVRGLKFWFGVWGLGVRVKGLVFGV